MNVPTPKITAGSLPASRKIYVAGERFPDIGCETRSMNERSGLPPPERPEYPSSIEWEPRNEIEQTHHQIDPCQVIAHHTRHILIAFRQGLSNHPKQPRQRKAHKRTDDRDRPPPGGGTRAPGLHRGQPSSRRELA